MGKTPIGLSPDSELRIKVQPRQQQAMATSPNDIKKARYPPAPPPPPYHLFANKKWFPWLVPTIVTINIVVFIIVMFINNCPAHSQQQHCLGYPTLGRFSFQSTHENPLLGPSANTLLKLGALEIKKVVEEQQVWRLLSCMWLHAGAFHVLANMLSLVFVGLKLEQEFGFVRIGLLYVISGIGGSLLSSLFVRNTISVGASGALFGLLGAMLSELLVNWTIYENKLESLLSLFLIILINMAVGILPHVDNFAHMGGFLSGFLLGFVILIRPQFGWISKRKAPYFRGTSSKSKYKAYQCVLLIVSILILTLGFSICLFLLLRGVDGNDHCSWCHYMSCVPTPLWTCEARCTTSQYQNELTLMCVQNHKSKIYTLDGYISTSHVQRLCAELCN